MPNHDRVALAATICNAIGGALITIASTLKQQADQIERDEVVRGVRR